MEFISEDQHQEPIKRLRYSAKTQFLAIREPLLFSRSGINFNTFNTYFKQDNDFTKTALSCVRKRFLHLSVSFIFFCPFLKHIKFAGGNLQRSKVVFLFYFTNKYDRLISKFV